jgi:hypothetical protein
MPVLQSLRGDSCLFLFAGAAAQAVALEFDAMGVAMPGNALGCNLL